MPPNVVRIPDELTVTWESVDAVPPWVAVHPPQPDRFRFLTTEASNLPELSKGRAIDLAERDGMQVLVEQFTPVLGTDTAQRLATAAWKQRRSVQAAVRYESGNGTVGSGLATAWVLWEVPIRSSLDTLEPGLRGRAERVLLRQPVPWTDVDRPPEWAAQPPRRDDWFRIVLEHDAEWHAEVRQRSTEAARAEVGAPIARRLRELVGDDAAKAAADAAVDDLHPVRRALWFRRLPEPRGKQRFAATVWVLWEVPVARILQALPRERQGDARARLNNG